MFTKYYNLERDKNILYNKYLDNNLYQEILVQFFEEVLIKNNSKYIDFFEQNLPKIQIKSQIGTKVNHYESFFSKYIEDVYLKSLPKRNINKDEDIAIYIYINKLLILSALEIEKQTEKEENRLLNTYLKKIKVGDFLKSFIRDKIEIKYYENFTQKSIYLKSLKTYSDLYENEDNRKDFIKLLNGEIKPRKSSELRNLKLKNNNNLKRKRSRTQKLDKEFRQQCNLLSQKAKQGQDVKITIKRNVLK